MANLTEMSIATRKLFVWILILFVIYLLLKVLFGMYVAYYKASHPIPIPSPNHNFNKLPNPKFSSKLSSSGMKFTLANIDNRPPETTDAAKVYLMPKKLPTLLAAQNAKNFVAKMNFVNEPQLLNSTLYRFTDPNDKLRFIDIDITNLNLHLRYDYTKRIEIFKNVDIVQKDKAQEEVMNFLSYNSLFDDSIKKGKVTVDAEIYDDILKGFKPASSISTANTLRINFFRSDLDNFKLVTPKYYSSYNYVLFTPSPLVMSHILEVSYKFWPISFDNFATYKIKNGQQAWQDLNDGYASIIQMGENKPDNITIRNIYLAYYDSEEPQNYLQPIYVFEGDNNFAAYLPAVDPEWLE